ncbi:hypothetical protein [Aquimarina aquimarini]|uniref:hypothetical protein n=1 Tax=Aquimarina aquimarini TaxID=1191734 RepID=UPI000D554E97|nr:hypothetical protein [Aquimarina aquimarini]
MKNLLKISYVLCFLFFLNSCEKEEDNIVDPQLNESISEEVAQESDTINYVYGPVTKVKDDIVKKHNTPQTIEGKWKKVTRDHLRKLSQNADINYLHHDDMLNRFTWAINKGSTRPKSVSVNDHKIGPGVNPCNTYGWHTEMRPKGKVTAIDNSSPTTDFQPVKNANARKDQNRSGKAKYMNLPGEWRIETYNESSWSITGSINTEIGAEVELPFFKSSIKVNVGLARTDGQKEYTKITEIVKNPDPILVPPGYYGNWELVESHKNYKSTWKIPMEFKGYVGADYGKKHDGHYFWAVSANKFFYEYTQRDRHYILNMDEEYGKVLMVRAWVSKY